MTAQREKIFHNTFFVIWRIWSSVAFSSFIKVHVSRSVRILLILLSAPRSRLRSLCIFHARHFKGTLMIHGLCKALDQSSFRIRARRIIGQRFEFKIQKTHDFSRYFQSSHWHSKTIWRWLTPVFEKALLTHPTQRECYGKWTVLTWLFLVVCVVSKNAWLDLWFVLKGRRRWDHWKLAKYWVLSVVRNEVNYSREACSQGRRILHVRAHWILNTVQCA